MNVQYDETPLRLKITIPIRVNWFLFALFSLLLAVWVVVLSLIMRFSLEVVRFGFVLATLFLLWLLVWLWSGRFLWNRWQYFAANREILFVEKEQLILRRPVSILGITTVYDFRHVTRFYYSDRHNCAAFDYTYYHVYFGHSLPAKDARMLVEQLNARFFPDSMNV